MAVTQPAAPRQHPVPEGTKSYVVALLLSWTLGMFGADRFYLGKTRSALVKLCTMGGFGYWWLIDLIITLCGGARDQWGLRLEGYDRNKKKVWIVIGWVYGAAFAIGLVSAAVMASFDRNGPTQFGWLAISILAGGAAVTGLILWLRQRRKGKKPAKRKRQADPVPSRVQAQVDRLAGLRQLYVIHAASGNQSAVAIIAQIDSMSTNVYELFQRLSVKSDKSQRNLASIEYEDKLNKLAAALDREYLLDIIANPHLWDEPAQRIHAVEDAMAAVDGQLLRNIRDVNAHRGLVFEVALDGLMGPKGEMDSWQRDFDKAAGTHGIRREDSQD
ncbi:TM2 domain-containing protein [Microbacterium sp. SCN 69-37]|uniref:TM2 domain-containing protein n=1 Tax=Microbacterium sp. SCN 69-37 TaxID=1660115 RepID=UPI0025E42F16|nr:TM2 domain-containing protein [Microbacterium sp. SCN 69-37]